MKKIIFFLSFLFLGYLLSGQDSENNFDRQNLPDNTTRREEIQRYAGYEDLPLLYLTLFYDAVMGSNIAVSFMDIGFILLLIFPLLLLQVKSGYKSISRLIFFLFCGFFFLIFFPSGFLNFYKITSDQAVAFFAQNPVPTDQPVAFISDFIRKIFLFTLPSFIKIETWLRQFQPYYGDITYPLLLILFFSILIGIGFILKNTRDEIKLLAVSIYLYTFLWILVSSGISWYGIAIFPLGALFILLKKQNWVVGLIVFQLVLHFPYRISRYEVFNPQAGQMFESASSAWITGQINDTKYIELLTGIPERLLAYLNQNLEGKIYKVGTNLHFFIKENDKRVFQDNQLGHFKLLNDSGNPKEAIASSLKNQGYKFLIADLAIQNMDQTPEKSLEYKHRLFLNFLHENPNLRLLFTDRVVLDQESRIGKPGIGNEGDRIIKKGKLAVFEIL